MLYSSPTVVQH